MNLRFLRRIPATTFAIFLIVIISCSNVVASQNQSIKVLNPVPALSGFGVNSMALWSGGSNANPNNKDEFLEHFKPLEDFGVKHVVLVSCADWIIDIKCKEEFQNLNGIIKAAKILLKNTNLHIVVQLKAYKKTKLKGKNISELNTKLETNNSVAKKFADTWGFIARELAVYSSDRLSFNLLNEPEF